MGTLKSRKYGSLNRQLSRAEVHQAGRVAKLFYECFVENIALISEKECVRRKITEGRDGEFKLWRSTLVRKGFLSFDLKHGCGPGPRIIDKINDYKLKEREIATVSQVKDMIASSQEESKKTFATKEEVQFLREKFNIFEDFLMKAIQLKDDPWTIDKHKFYMNDPTKLL